MDGRDQGKQRSWTNNKKDGAAESSVGAVSGTDLLPSSVASSVSHSMRRMSGYCVCPSFAPLLTDTGSSSSASGIWMTPGTGIKQGLEGNRGAPLPPTCLAAVDDKARVLGAGARDIGAGASREQGPVRVPVASAHDDLAGGAGHLDRP